MRDGLPVIETWTKWTGQVVDGLFPLKSCIGNSEHSGVFLTESPEREAPRAALKLIPALPTSAERLLAQWHAAASLSHPHLLRLVHSGRCQLAENHYLYTVMEYADQNLGDLLMRRALTEAEAWELLLPAVDALAFLHRKRLVHGHLKPSNILVIGDTLKLSSDTVRTADAPASSNGRPSVYHPPEGNKGTAADIWALGVTLTEGLTRAHPSGPAGPGLEAILPMDCPPTFVDAIRRCLSYELVDRPSIADLKDWMKDVARQSSDSIRPATDTAMRRRSVATRASEASAKQALPDEVVPKQSFPILRLLSFLVAGSVVILLVCWAAARFLIVAPAPVAPPAQQVAPSPEAPAKPAQSPDPPEAPDPAHAPEPIQDARESSPVVSPVPNTEAGEVKAAAPPSVLHKEIPKVPRAAREAIEGDVRVIVRVTVDSSGTVVREVLADPGSSTYFAQLAINAAGDWKFTEAQDQPSRQWLVRFVFSRDGTAAQTFPLRLKRTAMSR